MSAASSSLSKNLCLSLTYSEIVNFVYRKKYGSNIGLHKTRKITTIVIGINVAKNTVRRDPFSLVFVSLISGSLTFKTTRKYIKDEMLLCAWTVWLEPTADRGTGDEQNNISGGSERETHMAG